MLAMKTSSYLVTVSAFLVLLAYGGNAGATNYFNWGVESRRVNYGATQGQFDVQFASGTTQVCGAGVGRSGSCAMRLIVRGNDGGNQQMGADLLQQNPLYPFNMVGSPAIYYRWWMRIMPGFSWGNGTAKTKSSRTIAGVQGYTGYLMSYGFLIGECSDSGCTLNDGKSNGADSSLVINHNFRTKADGVWREYIVKIKPNTNPTCTAPINCDAQFEAWVDGVSVGTYNNFKLHNSVVDSLREAWGGWMVYPYFQLNGTASDGGTIFLDDFSVDNVFNSTVRIPPPANLMVK